MKILDNRIAQARKAAGLNQSELARALGVKPQAVQKWETGASTPRRDREHDLSRILDVSVAWLRYESDLKHGLDSNVERIILPRAMDVPLISWVQAGDWGEVIDNLSPGDAEEWMICPRKHGPNAFALRVRGVSMMPKYNDGDIIFVDPDAVADHGKNVIVRLENEKEATFKSLVIEDGRQFLRALNPEWTPRIMEIDDRATICGVVIGKWVAE